MESSLKNYIGNRVSNWYQLHGRHNLPWRKNITPYRIWISEIMLQQTQVNTAIDYFNKFMKQYPDLTSIKSAKEDDIYAGRYDLSAVSEMGDLISIMTSASGSKSDRKSVV